MKNDLMYIFFQIIIAVCIISFIGMLIYGFHLDFVKQKAIIEYLKSNTDSARIFLK